MYDSKEDAVFIPNEEVREEFVLAVTKGKHVELAKLIQNSDRLLEQTLNMDERAVEKAIGEAYKVVASPLSYNKEDSLRSTIRFAYIMYFDDFIEVDAFQNYDGDIYMVTVNYDENTKKHTCRIEKHKK